MAKLRHRLQRRKQFSQLIDMLRMLSGHPVQIDRLLRFKLCRYRTDQSVKSLVCFAGGVANTRSVTHDILPIERLSLLLRFFFQQCV